jgi:hypothetical protein
MKKELNARKLILNKKTVSALQSNEMAAIKGGLGNKLPGGITNPQSDSFIACGSCFGACATNTTISAQQFEQAHQGPVVHTCNYFMPNILPIPAK